MILVAALLCMQNPGPVRVDFTSRDEVCMCVAAPLPKLGHKDLELLQVGLKALGKGSQEYSPGTIREVTEGRGISCKLLGDSVLVSVTVPKGGEAPGVALLASLMVAPAFDQSDLDVCLAALSGEPSDYWKTGMHPERFDLPAAPHDDVLQVFQRVFRPDRAIFVFGGALGQADLTPAWLERTKEWSAIPEPRFPDISAPKILTEQPGPVTDTELISTPFKASDPMLPSRMLALYALGAGKGSSLFRIARERHTWSYRQEAYLWPTVGGWETRLFIPMIASPEAPERLETIRKELAADAAAWTEADRGRAVAMAEAALVRDLPCGPLMLGDEPITDTLQDEVEMAAFWHLKTGSDWDPQLLFQQLAKVDLDDLKASAQEILAGSHPLIIAGRG